MISKKVLQIGVLILLLVGSVVYYSRNQQKTKQTQKQEVGTTQNDKKTVEDYLKQSSNELVDPALATAKNSTTNKNTATKPKDSQASFNTEICPGQAGQTFNCYQTYYEKLTKEKGVAAAFVDLKVRYNQDSYVMSQCHPITHVIGNTAALIYKDVGIAYTKGDSYCWSGYYHGVMEGIVGKISSAELPKKLDGICNTIPGKASYSFDYYNCVHGLGHGVMAITQDELFDSLKLCDNLTGLWEQSSCWGGAFMENVIVDNKNHFTKYLKPEEPLYPCNAVDDKYKNTCYLMQTSYMLKVTGGNFTKVFELCSTVGNFATTCYQSLGRDASGRSISNAEVTKSTCNLGQDFEQKSNCIIGAVKDFVSYYHSDVQAKQLCDSLETELRSICSTTVEGYYRSFK